jgi:putative RNA 2'-phosphotransferase
MEKHLVQLSKTMAYVLRHDPQSHGLTLDVEGWVSLKDLLAALRQQRSYWATLKEADLLAVLEQSEKQRFEVRNGKIRAYYGHSVPTKVEKQPATPPEILYHGTTPQAANLIKGRGLSPMNRQYVHLSADEETAMVVARRRTNHPIILKVHARKAEANGVRFYLGNDMVWLAEPIPPDYIQFG